MARKDKVDEEQQQARRFIRVRAPGGSFWRAGRHFTREPVEIDLTDLSEEQLLAITGESRLAVEGPFDDA
ncbi:MAG: hypothetical protein IT532_00320 [Burkholderiales bacterium]|nr:hypothetical protein [Burkholderiales bacterium]